jgi:type II secretory pathway pseudopilin PulG
MVGRLLVERCAPRRSDPRIANERGDTLVEIIIAIVLIGAISSAFAIAIATGSTASAEHRNLVTADALLRSSAEATKAAARAQCNAGDVGAPITVGYPPSVVATAGPNCPALDNVSQVDLKATLPNGTTRLLSIDVRAP